MIHGSKPSIFKSKNISMYLSDNFYYSEYFILKQVNKIFKKLIEENRFFECFCEMIKIPKSKSELLFSNSRIKELINKYDKDNDEDYKSQSHLTITSNYFQYFFLYKDAYSYTGDIQSYAIKMFFNYLRFDT